MLRKIFKKKEYIEKIISIFAIGIVFTSFIQITALNFKHYLRLFEDLPTNIIIFRYCLSWSLRIVAIISAIGLLLYKNWARLSLLGLFIFTVLTVYLKHSYSGFLRHTKMLDEQYAVFLRNLNLQDFSFQTIALPSAIIAMLLDIFFALLFIYIFTRKEVKELFVKDKK